MIKFLRYFVTIFLSLVIVIGIISAFMWLVVWLTRGNLALAGLIIGIAAVSVAIALALMYQDEVRGY